MNQEQLSPDSGIWAGEVVPFPQNEWVERFMVGAQIWEKFTNQGDFVMCGSSIKLI